MAVEQTHIKQIKAGSKYYEVAARSLLDVNGAEKTYEDIAALISEGDFSIIVLNVLPEANAATYATYRKNIVLVADANPGDEDTYNEWVIVRLGSVGSYTYAWELLGNTGIEFNKSKLVTTSVASSTHTHALTAKGSVGLTANAATADGRITYVESISSTGASASGTADVAAQGHTHSVTISGSVDLGSNTTASSGVKYTEAVALTAASLGTASTGNAAPHNHTHTITISGDVDLGSNTTETDGVKYLEDVTYTAATLTGTKTFNTDAIKSAGLDIKTTSTSGYEPYIASATDAALSGTTTFSTNGIKDFSLAESQTSTDGPIYAKGGTTKYMKITTAAAGTGTVTLNGGSVGGTGNYLYEAKVDEDGVLQFEDRTISYTAPTLGGTTTFVTAAIKSASLSASDTSTDGPAYISALTTRYMKHTNTDADSGTVSLTGGGHTTKYMKVVTAAASTGTVGISGGSITKTTKYFHPQFQTQATTDANSGPKVTAVTGYPNFSGGSLSTNTVKYFHPSLSASGTANATTATKVTAVTGVAGGTTSATTKYLSASFTGSSATTSNISGTTTVATGAVANNGTGADVLIPKAD